MILAVQIAVTCVEAAVAQAVDPAAAEEETPAKPAPEPLLKAPRQCLYDYKQVRVNRDCHVELPPTCGPKATLVSTQIDATYEMCCCQYSNFVADEDV